MEKLKKYIYLLLTLLGAAINFNLILKPLNLVAGGTQGLAIIINHIFKISPALIILLINIIMLVVSYLKLPKSTTYGIIISTFLYPLFIKLTCLIPTVKITNTYIIIPVIIAGIICGLTGGYIYKLGFSSGGINVVAILFKKYFKIKISITNFFINVIIILLGSIRFGFIKGIYSIVIIIINSLIINKILGKKINTKNQKSFK